MFHFCLCLFCSALRQQSFTITRKWDLLQCWHIFLLLHAQNPRQQPEGFIILTSIEPSEGIGEIGTTDFAKWINLPAASFGHLFFLKTNQLNLEVYTKYLHHSYWMCEYICALNPSDMTQLHMNEIQRHFSVIIFVMMEEKEANMLRHIIFSKHICLVLRFFTVCTGFDCSMSGISARTL